MWCLGTKQDCVNQVWSFPLKLLSDFLSKLVCPREVLIIKLKLRKCYAHFSMSYTIWFK